MANYIVLEMDLNDKWWDKWFVVGGLRRTWQRKNSL